MKKESENLEADLMERTIRGLVTDIQRTFDSSIITAFLLVLVISIGVTPSHGIEDFSNKLKVLLPLSSSFLATLVFTLYNNLHFLRNNNKFKRYMKQYLKNDYLNMNAFLTVKERVSLFQLLMFIKIKLTNNGLDYDEEINRMISFFMES